MYQDYIGKFAADLTMDDRNGAIKRSLHQFEKGSFGGPCTKRTKLRNNQAQPIVCQQEGLQQSNNHIEMPFITPAPTPADVEMTDTAIKTENLPSPYSETEDYMFRGYYEEAKVVDNGWSCIESVQYSLYDMTPEEYELSNDINNVADISENNTMYAETWGTDEVPKGQLGFQCTFNDTNCNDSYDINMR